MDPYVYTIKQRLRDGTLWSSSEAYEGDLRHVQQNVNAGLTPGEPRWAETLDGVFLYGLDRLGKTHHMGTCSPDFSE